MNWKLFGMTKWNAIQPLDSRAYVCGHCGNSIASKEGWTGGPANSNERVYIYVCHRCTYPTFFAYDRKQLPGVPVGASVADIPDASVVLMYDEARRSYAAGAYTAAVLCCRKLLMHIAVTKGAKPGESFASYVKYLADKHYVPPDAVEWVDHIRTQSNEANHEIAVSKPEDSEELISFVSMLLKVIFEFPAAAKRRKGTATAKT